MKKILIILFLLILSIACSRKQVTTKILLNDNLNIEYREKKYLYDFVSIESGTYLTENYLIDTSEIGSKKINIKYKDSNNKKQNYSFSINIVDTTKPIIFASASYTIKKGTKIDLVSKAMCADNYTREMKCEVTGEYNVNKAGEYTFKFTTTDSSGNYAEKESKLIVKEKVNNASASTPYYVKDVIKKYKSNDTMIGIDVSKWQGNINWKKVKNDGIEFAIIRIGYGHDKNNNMVIDPTYLNNLKNAKKEGLLVGLYFYSYATSVKEAIEQAKWIVNTLGGEELDLPIAFDWEVWNKFMSYSININDLNDIALGFMNEITTSGYKAMNYGSANYLKGIWNTPSYPTWLAYYTSNNTFEKDYYIWQLTSSGKVNGINGYVDLNVLYK